MYTFNRVIENNIPPEAQRRAKRNGEGDRSEGEEKVLVSWFEEYRRLLLVGVGM